MRLVYVERRDEFFRVLLYHFIPVPDASSTKWQFVRLYRLARNKTNANYGYFHFISTFIIFIYVVTNKIAVRLLNSERYYAKCRRYFFQGYACVLIYGKMRSRAVSFER